MINTTDPGLIVVRFDDRRVLFDSVLLPTKVKGANGKGVRFFGSRSHVLVIESMFEGMDGEIQYRVSMRKHTPVYDDNSKLICNNGWIVSEPLSVFRGETMSVF